MKKTVYKECLEQQRIETVKKLHEAELAIATIAAAVGLTEEEVKVILK